MQLCVWLVVIFVTWELFEVMSTTTIFELKHELLEVNPAVYKVSPKAAQKYGDCYNPAHIEVPIPIETIIPELLWAYNPGFIPHKRLIKASQADQTHDNSGIKELKSHDLDERPLSRFNFGVLHLELHKTFKYFRNDPI